MKQIIAIIGLLILGLGFSSSYAHTTVEVGPYEIEAGWGDEPPVVGLPNKITIDVVEPGEVEGVSMGVNNAFKSMQATVMSGGASKILEISPDQRAGKYYAKIIPTKTGSMEVKVQGQLNGIEVDVIIPIEDVESRAIVDFPPTTGSSSGQEVGALKNALSSLQKDVSSLKSNLGGISTGSGNVDMESAYNFGVFGLSLGAAGVILAIIAMIRKR